MEYSVKPEEHELREARKVVQGALEACKARKEKETPLEIDMKWNSQLMDELDGATGKTFSHRLYELQFNSDWTEESIQETVAHEYAHTLFYEALGNRSWEDISFMWQVVLMEAHAQEFVDRIYPEAPQPARSAVEREELEELWPEIRSRMKNEIDWYSELMFGGENFPKWTGYTAAHLIGQELLEEHELEEFPDLKRSDVLEAGDSLFG